MTTEKDNQILRKKECTPSPERKSWLRLCFAVSTV